jgi:hypothetical protein
MIIVKCNPKVPFKIYNPWIQVKKFFKTKFKNSFRVFIHINLYLSFFLYITKKKNLMSEFLYMCVYIKPNSKIKLLKFVLISILLYLSHSVLIKIYHRLDFSFFFLSHYITCSTIYRLYYYMHTLYWFYTYNENAYIWTKQENSTDDQHY